MHNGTYCIMNTVKPQPSTNIFFVIAGVLPVGPRGVGKTYDVKAVQAFCSPACKVPIFFLAHRIAQNLFNN